MIGALFYWRDYGFDSYLFWWGLIGSIINSLGITCCQLSISKGPAGPASALIAVSNLFGVIV